MQGMILSRKWWSQHDHDSALSGSRGRFLQKHATASREGRTAADAIEGGNDIVELADEELERREARTLMGR